MDTFKEIIVKENHDQVDYGLEDVNFDSLSDGEFLIKVSYSSINYKDMICWPFKKKEELFGIIR